MSLLHFNKGPVYNVIGCYYVIGLYMVETTSCASYRTVLERRTGTWWAGSVWVSASSWLDGLLTAAVLGAGGGVVEEAVPLVALVQLEAGAVAAAVGGSSFGCLLANSVMLKTNWRQPSLM